MLKIFASTVADGSMKPLNKEDVLRTTQAREKFLQSNDIEPSNTTCVHLEYDGDDYCRYQTVDGSFKGDGITHPSSVIVDGLVVTEPGHALFLPLADCIGVVLQDPTKQLLMVSHLGRHNLEQFGGIKSVEYLIENHGTNPKNLTVWLSPAAGVDNYPLFGFENRSLHDVAVEQFLKAGVSNENITSSPIDTTKDTTFYSHSEFLKANRQEDGRFAIVAVLRPDLSTHNF